jgi:hypothetical protein
MKISVTIGKMEPNIEKNSKLKYGGGGPDYVAADD